MLVLALDTSTPRTSVAVLDLSPPAEDATYGGVNRLCRVVAEAADQTAGHPGERLAPMLEELFTRRDLSLAQISAVAVGLGPGPFTALRVGVVTAAALGDASNIPTYGCCSLDAIGLFGAPGAETLVVTDARRKQVYWARYDDSGRRTAGPQIDEPGALVGRMHGAVTRVVGPGVGTHGEAFAGIADRRADAWPEPQAIGLLVRDKVLSRSPSDALTPLYLRPPDARPPGPPKQVTQK